MKKLTGNNPYMLYSAQISQKQDEHNTCYHENINVIKFISLLWDLSTLCVVDHLLPLILLILYSFTPCLAYWALSGSLVPAIGNRIYIYIYIYILTTLIKCSISCTIEWFNSIMVKMQLNFKYAEFHVNYVTIFSYSLNWRYKVVTM